MEKLGIKRINLQATKESMAELKLLAHVLYTDTDFVRILIYVHCQHLFICLGPLLQTKNIMNGLCSFMRTESASYLIVCVFLSSSSTQMVSKNDSLLIDGRTKNMIIIKEF